MVVVHAHDVAREWFCEQVHGPVNTMQHKKLLSI